jgi:phage terminase small subunit
MGTTISDMPDSVEKTEFASLSPREQRLVQALLSGSDRAEAMRLAGYADSTIKASMGRIVSRDRIQTAIQQAMDRAAYICFAVDSKW